MANSLPTVKLVRAAQKGKKLIADNKQDEAIAFSGKPLAVFGAAGTGKTSTLIRKVNSLLSKGVDPNSILVITYGRERAAEIRDEIALKAGVTAFEPMVRTFHSLAFSIINYQLKN